MQLKMRRRNIPKKLRMRMKHMKVNYEKIMMERLLKKAMMGETMALLFGLLFLYLQMKFQTLNLIFLEMKESKRK